MQNPPLLIPTDSQIETFLAHSTVTNHEGKMSRNKKNACVAIIMALASKKIVKRKVWVKEWFSYRIVQRSSIDFKENLLRSLIGGIFIRNIKYLVGFTK